MSREIKRALAVEPRKVEIAASDDEFVGQTRRRGDDLSGGSDDAGAADLLDSLFDAGLGDGDDPAR